MATTRPLTTGAVEKFRADGTGPKGYSPGIGQFESDVFDGVDPMYPGGPFDPLGLADDPEVFAGERLPCYWRPSAAVIISATFLRRLPQD